jgi:hypothetical protein
MPIGIATTVVGARLTASVRAELLKRANERGVPISTMAAIGLEEWLYPDAPPARTAPNGAKPPAPEQTPPQRLMAAVIATIAAEVRHEQNRPLGSAARNLPALLDTPPLVDVTDLHSARAAGIDAWVSAGCGPGLIAILFPDDSAAIRRAKQRQNKLLSEQRRSRGPQSRQIAARFGVVGSGAVALDKLMAGPFAGMTIEEAIAQGPAAWLEAGVTEGVARTLFNEPTAAEARRRSDARDNARRRATR